MNASSAFAAGPARRRRVCALCATVLALGCTAAQAAPQWWDKLRGKQAAEPLAPEQAFKVSAQWADATTVRVKFDVTPNYYLYRERTLIALKDSPGRRIAAVQFPPSVVKKDPNFGPMAVYPESFDVAVRLEGSAAQPVNLLVKYQGCYETLGVCYPPMTITIQPR